MEAQSRAHRRSPTIGLVIGLLVTLGAPDDGFSLGNLPWYRFVSPYYHVANTWTPENLIKHYEGDRSKMNVKGGSIAIEGCVTPGENKDTFVLAGVKEIPGRPVETGLLPVVAQLTSKHQVVLAVPGLRSSGDGHALSPAVVARSGVCGARGSCPARSTPIPIIPRDLVEEVASQGEIYGDGDRATLRLGDGSQVETAIPRSLLSQPVIRARVVVSARLDAPGRLSRAKQALGSLSDSLSATSNHGSVWLRWRCPASDSRSRVNV